jgi:hypothetical protein
VGVQAPQFEQRARRPSRRASAWALDAGALVREAPDVELAYRRHGCAMAQSFRVTLPDGRTGRCWLPTAEAVAIPEFGRAWAAAVLAAEAERLGAEALADALAAPGGLPLADALAAPGGLPLRRTRRPGPRGV